MMIEKVISSFLDKLGLDRKHFYTLDDLNSSDFKDITLLAKLQKLQVDAVYFFGDIPTLLFRFSSQYNADEIYQTLLKSWNFDKAPILFYVTDNDVIIYNTFVFPSKQTLDDNILGHLANLEDYHINHLTDELFWEEKKTIFNGRNRINYRLLQNIIDAKAILLSQGLQEQYIHNLMGRCLFLHYIYDRELLSFSHYIVEEIEDFFLDKELLFNIFREIKIYFNGDLFPITEEEYEAIQQEHLMTLHLFFKGGNISRKQPSLFSYYDFSIIPIELISNIYEKFLHSGDNKYKSYYTPLATVDLVYEQLLGALDHNQNNIKILDPSCGSGIFLVTFLKKYFEKNPTLISPNYIFEFIKTSLYGIDVDKDAIQITIFSIYISVLEFFERDFIKKHNFKFPDLLNKNFFIADFFNLDSNYNEILGTFDFIVGNPPWGTVKDSERLYLNYCLKNNFQINDKQIAQAFMHRVRDFMKPETIVALVLPSKIFYNADGTKFRESFLNHFHIRVSIEMSLERRKTFNAAIHPSMILFYENKRENKENIFTHLTLHPSIFYDLFKMFIFSEENIKSVNQNEIFINHWMWKTLLYGSQFDIEFIKRLKQSYSTLQAFYDSHNTHIGAGCIYLGKDKGRALPANIYLNYKILLTDEHHNTFFQNNIALESCKKIYEMYTINKFHDKGNIASYEGPHLLIKRGVSSKGFVVGVTEESCIFRNSVFGVSMQDIKILKFIAALYNSNLYQYFSFMTSSTWGVERPEVLMVEHKQLPIPCEILPETIIELAFLYEKIEEATQKNENLTGLFAKEQSVIEEATIKINSIVNKMFHLSKFEIDLMDYTLKTLPQISENKSNKNRVKDSTINQYIEKFLNEISFLFKKDEKNYSYKSFLMNKFVFIYINTGNEPLNIEQLNSTLSDKTKQKIFNKLIEATFNISIESLTSEIAFKRNIFGINQDGFYIVKPNQENTFHSINAQLDARSFINYWVKQ